MRSTSIAPWLRDLGEQTSLLSSPTTMTETPAYRELLAMGDSIVGELVDALSIDECNPVAIMTLLAELTGANPVPDEDRGNVEKMIEAWKSYDRGG